MGVGSALESNEGATRNFFGLQSPLRHAVTSGRRYRQAGDVGVPQRGPEDINHRNDCQTKTRHGEPSSRSRLKNQILGVLTSCDGAASSDTLLVGVRGSIGQILIQQGVIDAAGLSDALARQSGRHPVASELYMLGYASERELATALSSQTGWPAIVLDESVIRLDVLEHVTIEWARIFSALVVHEDERTLVVAAARPEDAIVPARELGTGRGKYVELRIALDVTLARTIRVAFRRWKAGDVYLNGIDAKHHDLPHLAFVHPDGGEDEHRRAQRALAEEAARNIERNEDLPSEELSLSGVSAAMTSDWLVTTTTTGARMHPTDFDEAAEERTQ